MPENQQRNADHIEPISEPVKIAALYHFTRFDDVPGIRQNLLKLGEELAIRGTLLIAEEGINGTIAGSALAIDTIISHIRQLPGCHDIAVKYSTSPDMPFYRLKVRHKREIVTMGVDGIDPNLIVGTYVEPDAWNELISDPDVVLIDTRNDYEVDIGTFAGAINPDIQSFRQFPEWLNARKQQYAGKKFAMFCTGGIRCEKSTAFAIQQGIDEVYHLKGGILKYLEQVPEHESLWQGECFVFDERVSVGHDLKPGPYELCRACRRPISEADKQAENYEAGVSCRQCFDERTTEDRDRYRQRQKQINLGHIRALAKPAAN